jgi:hypothetical protein
MAGVVGKPGRIWPGKGDHEEPEICAMRIGERQASRRLETRNFDDLNLGERNHVGQ